MREYCRKRDNPEKEKIIIMAKGKMRRASANRKNHEDNNKLFSYKSAYSFIFTVIPLLFSSASLLPCANATDPISFSFLSSFHFHFHFPFIETALAFKPSQPSSAPFSSQPSSPSSSSTSFPTVGSNQSDNNSTGVANSSMSGAGSNTNGFGQGSQSDNASASGATSGQFGQATTGGSQLSQGISNDKIITTGNGSNNNTTGFLTFEDHNLGIRMQYPSSGWLYEVDKETRVYFRPSSGGAVLMVEPIFIKDRITGNTSSNLVLAAKVLINQFRGNNSSFKVQSVTPNDDTSVLIRMSWTGINDSDNEVGAFILKISNSLILASYDASPQRYSQFTDTIAHMVNSIEKIETPSVTNNHIIR
jgi:hypothetical protein